MDYSDFLYMLCHNLKGKCSICMKLRRVYVNMRLLPENECNKDVHNLKIFKGEQAFVQCGHDLFLFLFLATFIQLLVTTKTGLYNSLFFTRDGMCHRNPQADKYVLKEQSKRCLIPEEITRNLSSKVLLPWKHRQAQQMP